MKRLIFLLALVVASSAFAQDVDNQYVSVTFKGDRASVTLKDCTANFAIGELVDAVKAKDFRQSGEYAYGDIYVGNPEETGLNAIWYICKDSTGYSLGFLDGPAEDNPVSYSSLSDAKKEMKRIMRNYYAAYGTLDPTMITKK